VRQATHQRRVLPHVGFDVDRIFALAYGRFVERPVQLVVQKGFGLHRVVRRERQWIRRAQSSGRSSRAIAENARKKETNCLLSGVKESESSPRASRFFPAKSRTSGTWLAGLAAPAGALGAAIHLLV
jgi:hypothetical protein